MAVKYGPGAAARNGTFATVIIGDEATKYKVHKALLVQCSEYFKRALNGTWQEAKDGVIQLEDVEWCTFELFVDWLYSRRLPSYADLDLSSCTCLETTRPAWNCRLRAEDLRWMKFYVFADRFQVARLKSAVLKAIRDVTIPHDNDSQVFYETIIYAFANLAPDDVMLKLLVDAYCLHNGPEDDAEEDAVDREQLPHDFLLRVMQRYGAVIKKNITRESLNENDYKLGDGEGKEQVTEN